MSVVEKLALAFGIVVAVAAIVVINAVFVFMTVASIDTYMRYGGGYIVVAIMCVLCLLVVDACLGYQLYEMRSKK